MQTKLMLKIALSGSYFFYERVSTGIDPIIRLHTLFFNVTNVGSCSIIY